MAAQKTKKAELTAKQLVDFLRESGTPSEILDKTRPFLKRDPGAAAEQLYEFMVEEKITHGTLRKAGKQIWGYEFEPETGEQFTAQEEAENLKMENELLRQQLAESNADRNRLTKANELLAAQKVELTKLAAAAGKGAQIEAANRAAAEALGMAQP